MKSTNDPLSPEGSGGQMIALCVTVTSIHINKSTGLCLLAVSVTCWYRENSQLMVGPKKKKKIFFFSIHSHEILFKDTSLHCKNANPE